MQNKILKQGEVCSLQVRGGETIRSNNGVLWLTIDGRSEDYLLRAGQSWQAGQTGRAVVQALQAGEMEYSRPARFGIVARLKLVGPWRQTAKPNGHTPGAAKRQQPRCPA